MKLSCITLLAAACTLPALGQSRTYFQSQSGTAEVRTPRGGYGFAGEIDAQGQWHGIDSNGKRLHGQPPQAPGVTFFDPDDPQQMQANVPFVQFGQDGRVAVTGIDAMHIANPGAGASAPYGSPAIRLRNLCRHGNAGEALRQLVSMRPYAAAAIPPSVRSMVYFRNGRYAEAARAATEGQLDNETLNWRLVRQFYAASDDYVSDVLALRTAAPTSDVQYLTAIHCVVCGDVASARITLQSVLSLDGEHDAAMRLLGELPPHIP